MPESMAAAVIVALDISLTATGYARSVGYQTATMGTSGVLSPPKTLRGVERLAWYRAELNRITADATLVVIEGYAFGASEKGTRSIAELGGVVRLALYDRGVPFVEIPPSCLKLFATGSGNAKKDLVLTEAVRKLKYSGASHDEADALWMLWMARGHYAGIKLPETKARAMAKLTWPALSSHTHEEQVR